MPKKLEKKLQIYFSAPSIKTKEQEEVFLFIRNTINNLGYGITYDWIADKTKDTPKCLFQKAVGGINLADVIIAEVTFPSTGVGQQIAIAKGKKIPVIALFLENIGAPSRFTLGSENDLLKTVCYSKANLVSVLEKALSEIRKNRFERFNFISTPEINIALESKSHKLGITRSQLLRHIVKDWMDKKE